MDNTLSSLSGQTKALIIVNEYRLGLQDISTLAQTLSGLVSSDLERVGIMELIKQQAPTLGLSPEHIAHLIAGLSSSAESLAPIPPTVVSPPPEASLLPPVPLVAPVVAPEQPTPHRQPMPPVGSPLPSMQATEPTQKIRLRQGGNAPRPATTPSHTQFIPKVNPANFPASPPPQGGSQGNQVHFGSGGMSQVAKRIIASRILLADDDARIRMVFRRKLEDNGYSIEEANSGEIAWQKLQEKEYGLAILDMKMPGLHGLELLARLTAAGGTQPVIICSAYEQLKEEFVVSTYPQLRYLVKPVNIDDLLAAVRELAPAVV